MRAYCNKQKIETKNKALKLICLNLGLTLFTDKNNATQKPI